MYCPFCRAALPIFSDIPEISCDACHQTFTLTIIDDEFRIKSLISDFRAGNKISAIKQMRTLTCCGLKTAKLLVEAMMALDGGRNG